MLLNLRVVLLRVVSIRSAVVVVVGVAGITLGVAIGVGLVGIRDDRAIVPGVWNASASPSVGAGLSTPLESTTNQPRVGRRV